MKIFRKSFVFFVSIIFLVSLFAMSCKTQRTACPAYGGEAKRFQIDRTY
ncbi:MAG: hypothetical protein AB9842_06820 [Bacteroidales bacterium]